MCKSANVLGTNSDLGRLATSFLLQNEKGKILNQLYEYVKQKKTRKYEGG